VQSEITEILEHHAILQMYYCGDAIEVYKSAGEIHLGHKWFDNRVNFCEWWAQMSFDPDYTGYTLNHFTPMIQEIFSRQPFEPDIVGVES